MFEPNPSTRLSKHQRATLESWVHDSALAGAEEAGRSRIYQGIHFQLSNEDGRHAGWLLGQELAATRLQRETPQRIARR